MIFTNALNSPVLPVPFTPSPEPVDQEQPA